MTSSARQEEQILYRAHLHWVILFRPFILGLVGLTILAIGMRFDREFIRVAGGVFVALAVLQVILVVMNYYTCLYQVTTRRATLKTGVLRVHSVEVLLVKVESIVVEKSIVGNLLGFGTLIVIGTGGTREAFHDIDEPEFFRQAVYDQIEANRT